MLLSMEDELSHNFILFADLRQSYYDWRSSSTTGADLRQSYYDRRSSSTTGADLRQAKFVASRAVPIQFPFMPMMCNAERRQLLHIVRLISQSVRWTVGSAEFSDSVLFTCADINCRTDGYPQPKDLAVFQYPE